MPPLKFEHIAYGAISLCVLYDLTQNAQIKSKVRHALRWNDILQEQLTATRAQSQYLHNKLVEHGVEFDDFDLIALNNLP